MNFQCIRCGYECNLKTDMKKHFSRKNTCKPKFKDIELTDSIKEDILENKIYSGLKDSSIIIADLQKQIKELKEKNNELKKQNNELTIQNNELMSKIQMSTPSTVINNNVNNVNNKIVNKIIVNLSAHEKLDYIVEHIGKKMLDFDDYIYDTCYDKSTNYIENPKCKQTITSTEMLETIDSLTSISKPIGLPSINVIYDKNKNKICIYRIDKWEQYYLDDGIKVVVNTIKSNYFDNYEKYLIKKLSTTFCNATELTGYLREYYYFISAFDILPFVNNVENDSIIENYNTDNEFSLSTHYSNIYKDEKAKHKKTTIKKIINDVTNIIKVNSKTNIEYINKEIEKLLHISSDFGQKLINLKNS